MCTIVIVITFQSKDVVEQILKDGIYLSCKCKQREGWKYKEIEMLGGYNPVWVFGLGTRSFTTDDFTDAYFLNLFKCEMSLNDDVGDALSQFEMVELDVDISLMKQGITHNACRFAYVIPYITVDMLRAVYKISSTDEWYYPKIDLVSKYQNNILFQHGLVTYKTGEKRIGRRY